MGAAVTAAPAAVEAVKLLAAQSVPENYETGWVKAKEADARVNKIVQMKEVKAETKEIRQKSAKR